VNEVVARAAVDFKCAGLVPALPEGAQDESAESGGAQHERKQEREDEKQKDVAATIPHHDSSFGDALKACL
jgi:hypothetical protein